MKMLEKDPNKRPQSMQEFVEALDQLPALSDQRRADFVRNTWSRIDST
ncbi:MAG: hypothetical protein R3C24_04185 [Cyanobacteriota/Melainabacteria group bacterium]